MLSRLWVLLADSIAPLSLIAGSYITRTPPAEVLQIIWFVCGCQITRATLASGAALTSASAKRNRTKGIDDVSRYKWVQYTPLALSRPPAALARLLQTLPMHGGMNGKGKRQRYLQAHSTGLRLFEKN